MKHGLLNPPVEAAACRQMLDHVAQRIVQMERELTSVTLDRETYLEKIGAVKEARALMRALDDIYGKEFRV